VVQVQRKAKGDAKKAKADKSKTLDGWAPNVDKMKATIDANEANNDAEPEAAAEGTLFSFIIQWQSKFLVNSL
jgi:hypothetical protein